MTYYGFIRCVSKKACAFMNEFLYWRWDKFGCCYLSQAATLPLPLSETCGLTSTSQSATTRWRTSSASCLTWRCLTTFVLWWRLSGRLGCRNNVFPSMISWSQELDIWTCESQNLVASFMVSTAYIHVHSRCTWGRFDDLLKNTLQRLWFYISRWVHVQDIH